MATSLAGKVALVAGATRGGGRGIAVQLGAAGATVYVTGRSSGSQRSEMNRPETIEETAALVDKAGGRGIAIRVDHLVSDEVEGLVQRIEREQGALHILVYRVTEANWHDATKVQPHFAIPRVPLSLAAPSRRWPGIPTSRAGTASRSPAANWQRSTASPISTAAARCMAISGRSPGCGQTG